MRRRSDESTPSPHPNAFSEEFFDGIHGRTYEPAVPEADFSGPWRLNRLWGDGPPLWAVYRLGERGPCLTFDSPAYADLAYLTAAALSLTERPKRFEFRENDEGRLYMMQDGTAIASVHSPVLENTSFATDLTRLSDLRADPLALAQLLAATPTTVLRRAGVMVLDEIKRATAII